MYIYIIITDKTLTPHTSCMHEVYSHKNLEQEVLNISPKGYKRHKRCRHVMISISTANNKLKIIHMSMMQGGGGFEKLQFSKAPSIS